MRINLLVTTTLFLGSIGVTNLAFGAPSLCDRATWATCSGLIKDAIDKEDGSDPQRILKYALEWNRSYEARFDQLRKSGMIQPSFPDSEKIYEAVKEKLNPMTVAKDKTQEALLKAWLPHVANMLEWTSGPFIAGVKAFLKSSETASDYDELRFANDDVQRSVERKLSPYLESDWKSKLNSAIEAAGPQLRNP